MCASLQACEGRAHHTMCMSQFEESMYAFECMIKQHTFLGGTNNASIHQTENQDKVKGSV